MRRRGQLVAIGLLATLLAGCVAPPQPSGEPALPGVPAGPPELAVDSVERRIQEVTVRVRALGCDELGLGSGFVLPGGIVVTNRHVLGSPVEVSVNTWDGHRYPAEVLGVAPDADLALLQLDEDVPLPSAELRTTPVDPGEQVAAVGYPGGGPAQVLTGEVLGTADGRVLGEPAEVIRVEVDVSQGSSGGPLVDADGAVVGVVFAIEVDRGTGLAVPVTTLQDRLDPAALVSPPACGSTAPAASRSP